MTESLRYEDAMSREACTVKISASGEIGDKGVKEGSSCGRRWYDDFCGADCLLTRWFTLEDGE